jgi:hypothetical protein
MDPRAGHRADDDRVELVAVGGRAGGPGALMAVMVAVALGAGIVGVGFLGEGGPPPAPERASSAGPNARPTTEPTPSPQAYFEAPLAGYRVAVEPGERPALLFERGLIALFQSPDTGSAGGFPAGVTVSVGTPSRGASLLALGVTDRVYGRTIDRLVAAYTRSQGAPVASDVVTVDGDPAALLWSGPRGEVAPVALVVKGNRSFVISATGFDSVATDAAGHPSEIGLRRFLERFRFGPSLFVSRDLGFEVAMPVDTLPFGAESVDDEAAAGLWVFDDGTQLEGSEHSHAIGVSVGSEARPAFVRILPSELRQPQTRRIWGATLDELVAAYTAAVAPWTPIGPERVRLGRERAVRLVSADGLAETILAVHAGKSYIISTTGRGSVATAPHLDDFLATFAFLE